MPSFVRSGAPVGVNTKTASSQSKSSITALADGGFVVTWQTTDSTADGFSGAIKSQRFNAQGVAVGAEALVNNLGAGDQTAAQTASLANGGYVVTWQTSDTTQDGSGTAVKARLFDSTGAAVGGEFRVNSQTLLDQKDPTVSGLADGGFVVAWYTTDTSQDGAGWAIKAQRYDSTGVAVGTEFRVNTTAFGSQWKTDIAGLTNGGFVVTWQTGNDMNSQVYGQLYGADGVKVGGQFVANGSITYDTLGKVAALPGGGFVVTWMTYDSDSLGIRAQVFNASGAKVGSDFAVNTTSAGTQMDPDIATLADGTFLITWDDKGLGIKGQAFNASGQRIGGEFVVASGGSANGTGVAVAGLAGGKFVATFTNDAGTSSGEDIQLQMLQYDSTPNAAPQLGPDTLSVSKQENQTFVTTLFATDSDGPYAITYSIVGGTDAARFTLNAVTGTLTFVSAPNYEAPTDSDQNNVYQVIVRASDSENSDQQTISVTVTNVNEALAITSNGAGASAAISLAENKLAVTTVTAVDPEGAPITYSISGGADAARFQIDSSTGALSFVSSPDYEQPGDADGNNSYLVTVRASDGTWTDTQALTITVTNANDAPVITSNGGGSEAAVSVVEGALAVTTVAASDLEGAALSYAISGGADASRFLIDAATGALTFLSNPDFEQPADADGNNVYLVTVRASDGQLSDTQALSITVTNANERPIITSNGGGTSAFVQIDEGQTAVTTIVATDPDGAGAITYSITGGAHAALFVINAATGALSFAAAPDYEAPLGGSSNFYSVTVAASDGELSSFQTVQVGVRNVNEGVTITSGSNATAYENFTEAGVVTATDADGDAVSYAIAGGADSSFFTIDAQTGALAFTQAPNFEAPGDADGDNVYEVTVSASDGILSDSKALTISVLNRNEGIFISSNGGGTSASLSRNEGNRDVTIVAANDPDGTVPTYSILGGADAALFAIDALTGALTFIAAPDYEAPHGVFGINFYTVEVGASDGQLTARQTIQIGINNVNEGVIITSDANVIAYENFTEAGVVTATDLDGDVVSFAIAGGADGALFEIDAVTGALTFLAAPDHEAPADSNGDNVYEVAVSASDGTLSDVRTVTVTVADDDEPLAFVSGGGGDTAEITIAENSGWLFALEAVDPEGHVPSMGIAGGADAALFTYDSQTHMLRFSSLPNYEAPGDADGDNVYELVVGAYDGHNFDYQTIFVTVANAYEGISFAAPTLGFSVDENGLTIGAVSATGEAGHPIDYRISGGNDASLFTIDPLTGALRWAAGPDYEMPRDLGGDNVYQVIVRAGDGIGSAFQTVNVTVGNVNEAVTITSNGGGASGAITRAENGTAVTVVAASDADGGPVTYAIAGGADAACFTINAATGALAFIAAPNFEAPSDSGANNVYDVVVSASDGFFTDTQALAVTVGNVNEVLAIVSNGGGASAAVSVAENVSSVTVVAALDPDGTAATYSIVGGADAARFTINAQTGALQFVAAPDWEVPTDTNRDNVYAVVVRASDGQFTDDQTLSISVTNTRDGNNVTGTSAGDSISAASTNVALRTSNEEDVVFGGGGNDNIQGMAGDDELYGEAGNDVLVGGAGADRLTGGLGKDEFTYNAVSESASVARDLILDFSRSQGDKISLSAIDANSVLSGNQAFTFIGTSAFSNAPGQLRFETSGGMTTIWGDVNGDGIADLQIQLSGTIVLAASDFVL